MKEKLIIRNFGPIKNVELELGRFNVLIGDQGTGKSTIAKLYSLLKLFTSIKFLDSPANDATENDLNWQFQKYIDIFEIANYFYPNTEIFYEHPSANKKMQYKNQSIEATFVYDEFHFVELTYIVAERIFVSTLSDAFFGLSQFGTKFPTLFNRFGNRYSQVNKKVSLRSYKSILNADFTNVNGIDSVKLVNDKIIPLTDASSGLQVTMPLLVVFDDLVDSIILNNNRVLRDNLIVVEEPELNLFPETQNKLIKYLIKKNNLVNQAFKNSYHTNNIIVTTHSPYILTSLNNLMYAYTVGQNHKEEVSKIIEEKYWVNPNDVNAYQLLSDGTAKNMIADDGLIMAENINTVSREINEEFDLIQDIKIDFQNKES